jgi:NAD(P) transhydrogenase subunit alpha
LSHFTVFDARGGRGLLRHRQCVARAAHTADERVTNAVSGIILVGGILQVGSDNPLVMVIALAAVFVASINIFGGFLVTLRMLEMFRKD